ncbi:deoxyribose-phosphate aldolase [Cutibacterium sp. WCA-380-WT-3A]|uniref:Deoxyribose-phosphate aldolase n=1 Tax=Cutibacterium porci TaxID=2605781 RepID=A0A7K0J599_9ACTN|nr:deoxyribose-phosphate aldolase [Cutibacterium porci]MSS45121.1 deoxyribose-phosphate aldolase [Cutibacterium porci]
MTSTPLIDTLLDRRLADPVRFADCVRNRTRATWNLTEPLMVVAADHPARGALAAGGRDDAMADREQLLERCVTALGRPGVNGFLGTADMVADLANLGALDGKVVFGSMNRGGFAGASFELDDRMTGYDLQGILEEDLAGGKMLLRFDLSDPGTVATTQTCAEAVTALARARRIAMVEPFISYRAGDGKVVNDLSTDAVVKSVAMASALGANTSWTWLKLPAVDDMERVARATSLPILLLGGEVSADPDETRRRWARALGPRNVRGLVLGRSVLYPPDSDVAAAIDNAVQLLGAQA